MAALDIPQSVKDSLAASQADYVRLGKSGLHVSVPILGAMSFGDPKWAPWVIDEEAVRVLHLSDTAIHQHSMFCVTKH
jgi:hypothetical protein